MATLTQDVTSQDIDYLNVAGDCLKLRLFKPNGKGLFSLVVMLHGGAWNDGDFTRCDQQGEAWAKAGLAVASLDFRHGTDRYPSSLLDINYGIRWLKTHAQELDLNPSKVGLAGQSSGGHLAMLAAMRPKNERYTCISVENSSTHIDAAVQCVGMAWPVINPLSRYRHAKRCIENEGEVSWAKGMPEKHENYWVTEENMSEGNPMLALERGETVETPPAIWVQGQPDIVHDYRDLEAGIDVNEPERFAQNYRAIGGKIEVFYVEYDARQGPAGLDPLTEFFIKYLD